MGALAGALGERRQQTVHEERVDRAEIDAAFRKALERVFVVEAFESVLQLLAPRAFHTLVTGEKEKCRVDIRLPLRSLAGVDSFWPGLLLSNGVTTSKFVLGASTCIADSPERGIVLT